MKTAIKKLSSKSQDEILEGIEEMFDLMFSDRKIKKSEQDMAFQGGAIDLLSKLALPGNSSLVRNRAFNTLGTMCFSNTPIAKAQLSSQEILDAIVLGISDPDTEIVGERAFYLASNLSADIHDQDSHPMIQLVAPKICDFITSLHHYDSHCVLSASSFIHKVSTMKQIRKKLLDSGIVPHLLNIMIHYAYSDAHDSWISSSCLLAISKIQDDPKKSQETFSKIPKETFEVIIALEIRSFKCAIMKIAIPETVIFPDIGHTGAGMLELIRAEVARVALIEGGILDVIRDCLQKKIGEKEKNACLHILWALMPVV
eukprot:c12901_g1_i2.p1 GENE.c12901_g1_i2~~c12901_g1_i2.p1  ORF type:complete len:314 (-),score=107.27 c12901_g1_i2:30-971(-)